MIHTRPTPALDPEEFDTFIDESDLESFRCRALWAAVLFRAVRDIVDGDYAETFRSELMRANTIGRQKNNGRIRAARAKEIERCGLAIEARDDALQWACVDADGVGSFVWVCTLLNRDVAETRTKMIERKFEGIRPQPLRDSFPNQTRYLDAMRYWYDPDAAKDDNRKAYEKRRERGWLQQRQAERASKRIAA